MAIRASGRIAIGVVIGHVLATALQAQDLERGKVVYDRWCASCHGDTGAGDGEGARYMFPLPRDFTRGVYQIRTTASGELPTDADIRRIVDDGMPGTAMPGWRGRLSSQERADVVAYLKTFSRFFEGAAPEPLTFTRAPRVTDEGLAEGARVFRELECYRCHGDGGRGDGYSAPTLLDDWDLPIWPADLTKPWRFNGGSTVEDIYRRLRTGLDGTPMPSFADAIEGEIITDEQLWRVAQYVRSLAPEREPRVRAVIRARLSDGSLPSGPRDAAWDDVETFYIPLGAQIIVPPRWFAPRVAGLWVRALHDGNDLALLVSWTDPSQSPDPAWQEWIEHMAATMTDADGPIPTTQGPDRLHVQFPAQRQDGSERPYFLGGDRRRPAYQWRWTSAPDDVNEGTSTSLTAFTPLGLATPVTHVASFDNGEWRVQFRRAISPATTDAPAFNLGEAMPIAFLAADGSNGEDEVRSAISSWYAIYLDKPVPTRVFIAPVLAALITAGLGMFVVWRAQKGAHQSQTEG